MPIILKLMLCFCSFIILGDQDSSWNVKDQGGIRAISNPKTPSSRTNAFSIKEDLVIGNDSQTENSSFVQLKQLLVDDDENIYAADSRESRIKVFSRDGKLRKIIGKKGQGPGEIDGIIAISFSGRQKDLLIQEANRNLAYFSIEGVFIRKSMILNENALLVKADSDENVFVFCGILDKTRRHRLIPFQGFVLKKFDNNLRNGEEIAVFPAADPNDFDMGRLPVWEIGLSGSVLYGFPDKYEVDVYHEGIKKRIRREWDKIKFTDEESANIKKMLSQVEDIRFASVHGAFSRFFLDDTGKLFVQTWEKTPENTYFFDVFDEEGRYISKISLPGLPQLIKRNKLFTIEENSDGFQVIKRYEIVWK
jgi:hypothetical protein